MSKECSKCGKKAMSGHNVSHSNRKTKRSFKVNLQSKKIDDGGVTRKVLLCSKCIKSMHK